MKKALLIGIDYHDISGISLRGCINDIINMRNMLIDAYDYEPNNIIMLRDDDSEKFIRPTHYNIYDEIMGIVLESSSLDEIWLHYSGHGSKIQNQISNCSQEILVPVDYQTMGCITDKDLYDMVRRIKCRAILTFDCCHSGTMCDLPWSTEYQSGVLVSTKVNKNVITNPHIFMFSGCKDEQTSADTMNLLDQHVGAFTNAFTECLRNSHHNTSILSLHKDICIYLINNGYNQIPILSSTVETPNHVITKIRKEITVSKHQYKYGNLLTNNYRPYSNTGTNNSKDVESINSTDISLIISDDPEEINRGFLPLVSSGSSVTSDTISALTRNSITKIGKHFYKRLSNHTS